MASAVGLSTQLRSARWENEQRRNQVKVTQQCKSRILYAIHAEALTSAGCPCMQPFYTLLAHAPLTTWYSLGMLVAGEYPVWSSKLSIANVNLIYVYMSTAHEH